MVKNILYVGKVWFVNSVTLVVIIPKSIYLVHNIKNGDLFLVKLQKKNKSSFVRQGVKNGKKV